MNYNICLYSACINLLSVIVTGNWFSTPSQPRWFGQGDCDCGV